MVEALPEGSYAGAGLHGVAQVTAEVARLVLRIVAAGQLGQALGKGEHNRGWSRTTERTSVAADPLRPTGRCECTERRRGRGRRRKNP